MDDPILRYVTMPMTIRIFKDDKEKFKVSTMSMLYDDIFDSMIEALQHDYNEGSEFIPIQISGQF